MGFAPLRVSMAATSFSRLADQFCPASAAMRWRGPLLHGRAALLLQHRQQRAHRFAHVGADGHLRRIVLGEIPIDEADLDGLEARPASDRPRSTPTCGSHRRRARSSDRAWKAPRAPRAARASSRRRSRGFPRGSGRHRHALLHRRARRSSRQVAQPPSSASLLTISSPATISGRSALRMRSASAASASSEGRTRLSTRVELPRSMPPSMFRMSPGSEMNTGPVGGVMATLAARRMMRGRSSSRVTSTAHFTSGAAIGTSGVIEQRLGQAMTLLLLAGGEDHRRAGELGVVERAHGIAEAGRHVDVAGRELARRAPENHRPWRRRGFPASP